MNLGLGRAHSNQGLYQPGPGGGEGRDESTSKAPMVFSLPANLGEEHRENLKASLNQTLQKAISCVDAEGFAGQSCLPEAKPGLNSKSFERQPGSVWHRRPRPNFVWPPRRSLNTKSDSLSINGNMTSLTGP